MADTKKEPVPVFVIKRLGDQVPQFDLPVSIQKLDGTPAQITLRCNAMKKTEWAAIKDTRQREAVEATLGVHEAAAPAAEPEVEQAGKKPAGKRKPTKAAPTPEGAPDPAKLRETVLRTLAENSMEGAVNEALKADVGLVMKFAIGWELEDDFNATTLAALENEFAGSLEAAMNAYDRAIFRGQLGNSKT